MEPAGRDEHHASRVVLLLCFVLFSTVGMAAIGAAILAVPITDYFVDQDILQAQRFRRHHLEKLWSQREELLGRSDSPEIIDRAARKLRLPIPPSDPNQIADPTAEQPHLPEVWPELEKALARIGQASPIPQPYPALRRFAKNISENPVSRLSLFALGSALILLSLTCFNRAR